MKRILAAALALCLALPARAQNGIAEPPPPPPEGEDQTRRPLEELGYFESCFGVPRVGAGRFGIGGEVVVPISGQSGRSAPSFPVASGGSDDKAWLVVAVVAAMALPVVLYAVDKPAPRIVQQRFRCPTLSFDLYGGADNGPAPLGTGAVGFVTSRFTFGIGHIATDFQYDHAPGAVSAISTHFLLRVTPRDHVEGGLAIGYRRAILQDRMEDGLEFGLPHRYALWRDGLKTVALEIRPLLMLGSHLEPSLEAALLLPLAQVLQLRVGGRVYTFAGDALWGFSAGLSLTL